MKIKRYLTVLLCLVSLVCLSACHTSMSYTFQIDNGEKLVVNLDTTDGYKLSQEDGTFTIEKDGKEIFYGRFLKPEGFALYQEELSKQENAKLIKLEPSDSPTTCVYTFDGKAGPEVDYVLKVNGGETVVYMYTLLSLEEADKVMNLLTFEFE